MCGPSRGATLNLTVEEKDKLWQETEKIGTCVLDPETKMLWDEEMRARVLDLDIMSSEGRASLEGQTFFGMDKQVSFSTFSNLNMISIAMCGLGAQ